MPTSVEGQALVHTGERLGLRASLRRIPCDAETIAEDYASALRSPCLDHSLQTFLHHVASIRGIEAIGLAIWDKPQIPPVLCIYAVTEVAGLFEQGSAARHTADSLEDALGILESALHQEGSLLSCTLNFVDPSYQSLPLNIADLRRDLATDPYIGLGDDARYLCRLTVARIAEQR